MPGCSIELLTPFLLQWLAPAIEAVLDPTVSARSGFFAQPTPCAEIRRYLQ